MDNNVAVAKQRRNLGLKSRLLAMFGIRILFGFLATVWKESIGILLIFLIVVYIMLFYELDNCMQVVGI